MVEQAWNQFRGKPIEALGQVKYDSITFNKEVFGNIFRRKKEITARLKGVQKALERVDSLALVQLEKTLQHDYNQVLFQEEVHWYQKSREQWVKLGDKNTAFSFHAQTIVRRKRNKIHGLNLPNGIWCSDDATLQEEALKYFKSLFCSTSQTRTSSFHIQNLPCLDAEAVSILTSPVTKEEVFKALNTMKHYKAPGLDGFQAILSKQYWHLIGDDVWHLVRDSFVTGTVDPSLGETLIDLIPKVDHPQNFKEFRPISLWNTIYKLITKVLVQHLRPILSEMIGPFQSSFLP